MVTIEKFHNKRLYLAKYLSYKAKNYIKIIRSVMFIFTLKRNFALILSEKKLFKKNVFCANLVYYYPLIFNYALKYCLKVGIVLQETCLLISS